jgi:hypothetical protein
MSIAEVLARYADSASGDRQLRYLPPAAPVAGSLPGAAALEPDAADVEGGAVVVDLAQSGAEAAAIGALGALLGERGVGVLILASTPESMAVGPVLQAATQAALRVVQAEGLASRHGRTILVLTRDPAIPQRSYLLGEPLPDAPATRLRQANEWAVEGLQLRALSGVTQTQLSGAREEARLLRVERDELAAAWAAERKRLNARIAELTEAPGALRSGMQHLKKAASLMSSDTVGGSRRIAKAAARRARR